MKNILPFKLEDIKLQEVSEDVYTNGEQYFIGLSFEQEPDLDEGTSSADISQYPLEDVLDKFGVYVDSFCENYNKQGNQQCRLVFASDAIDNIMDLKNIIGKHVYNFPVENDGEEYIDLIIE